MAIEPTDDGLLSPDAKRALVLYELERRDALRSIPFALEACRVFPMLGDNTAVWVRNQQERGSSEWPWFVSALKFLAGYDQQGSDFERYRERLFTKLKVEIKKIERREEKARRAQIDKFAEANAHRLKVENDRKKLIGGLGGIQSDPNPPSNEHSYWGRVDAGHWREQK